MDLHKRASDLVEESFGERSPSVIASVENLVERKIATPANVLYNDIYSAVENGAEKDELIDYHSDIPAEVVAEVYDKVYDAILTEQSAPLVDDAVTPIEDTLPKAIN